MTHLRREDAPRIHNRLLCRRGRHLYGKAQQVGGGIVRQVCTACGSVTIDLTTAGEETHHSESSRAGRREAGF